MARVFPKIILVGLALFAIVPVLIGDIVDRNLMHAYNICPGVSLAACLFYFFCIDKLFKSKNAATDKLTSGLALLGYLALVCFLYWCLNK